MLCVSSRCRQGISRQRKRTDTESADEDPEHVCVARFLNGGVPPHEEFIGS